MSRGIRRKLEGHVAVIVGASRRTGRELALRLADDAAHVVVTAREARAEIDAVVTDVEARGGRAEARLLDVTDPANVEEAFHSITRSHGRIDALVCNAAIRRQSPFLEMSLAEWREIMATHLDGVFLCFQPASRLRPSSTISANRTPASSPGRPST